MPRKQKTKSKKPKATKQKQKQRQSVSVKVNIDQSQRSQPFRNSSPSIMGGSHTTFLPAYINQQTQPPPQTQQPQTAAQQLTEPPRRQAAGFEGVPVGGDDWADDVTALSDVVPDYPVVENGSVHTEETVPHDFQAVDEGSAGFFDVPVVDDYSIESGQSHISAGQVIHDYHRRQQGLEQQRRAMEEMGRFVEQAQQPNDLVSLASSGGGTVESTMSPNALRLATHTGLMEQNRLLGLARGRQTQREQAEARRQQTAAARRARLERQLEGAAAAGGDDNDDEEVPVITFM